MVTVGELVGVFVAVGSTDAVGVAIGVSLHHTAVKVGVIDDDFVLRAVPDDVPLVEDVGEVESEIEADGDADGDTLLDALVERDMERVAVLVTVTLPVRD